MAEPIAITPIGVVHCAYRGRAGLPSSGGRAEIEIFAEYTSAIEHIEQSSHIIVLAWMHEADRKVLHARPRRLDPAAPSWGVCATRSPDRPNPVAVTVVPLIRRTNSGLFVDRLDLVDGTPVIDIKAYCPGWDSVFAARRVHRSPPPRLNDHQVVDLLERDLESHLGHEATSMTARITLAAVFVAVRILGLDPRDPALKVTINRCDATIDAVMGLTGASFAGGRLAVVPDDRPLHFRFVAHPQTLDLALTRRTQQVLDNPERWLAEAFMTSLASEKSE